MTIKGRWVELNNGEIYEITESDDSPFVEGRQVIFDQYSKIKYSQSYKLIRKDDIIDNSQSYKMSVKQSILEERNSKDLSEKEIIARLENLQPVF